MAIIKQIAFSGGAIASWQWGVAMGWYDQPHFSPLIWGALWFIAGAFYCLTPPLQLRQ